MSEHLCVTVCTRQRDEMLKACLNSVLPQLEASDARTSLVVVENDDSPRNRQMVRELAKSYAGVRVEYHLETVLGIPFARNAAIEAALSLRADWVLFIDDDEEARPGWLEAYRAAIRRSDADVFRGPVEYIYPDDQPEWLRMKPFDGGPTGSLVRSGTTNNLAAKASLFAADGQNLRFDTRLRFCGGEDVELFQRATNNGSQIRWVGEAVTIERQRGVRLSQKWILNRTRNVSASTLSIKMDKEGTQPALSLALRRSARLVMQAALQCLIIPLLVVRPHQASHQVFKVRKKISRLHGFLLAANGALPSPYKQDVN